MCSVWWNLLRRVPIAKNHHFSNLITVPRYVIHRHVSDMDQAPEERNKQSLMFWFPTFLLLWLYQQKLYHVPRWQSPPPRSVHRRVTFSLPLLWLLSNCLYMGAFKTISCSFTRPQRTLVSMAGIKVPPKPCKPQVGLKLYMEACNWVQLITMYIMLHK